jgi:hypothetical protein
VYEGGGRVAAVLALSIFAGGNLSPSRDLRFAGSAESRLPFVILAAVSAGDLVRDFGIGVYAPEPGGKAWAFADGESGGQTLGLETQDDGTVIAYYLGDDSDEQSPHPQASPAHSGTAECLDDYPVASHGHWTTAYSWYFNSGSTPSELVVDSAEQALRDAAVNITHMDNNCGAVDSVSATVSYLGRTTRAVDMDVNANCSNNPDGYNVVSFGTLPSPLIAFTCWWWGPITIDEADVRLKKSGTIEWVVNPGAACSGKYFVEGVATHERGHVYGLNDVTDEANHGNLTMSNVFNHTCSGSNVSLDEERTLAAGDYGTLVDLYP